MNPKSWRKGRKHRELVFHLSVCVVLINIIYRFTFLRGEETPQKAEPGDAMSDSLLAMDILQKFGGLFYLSIQLGYLGGQNVNTHDGIWTGH